MSVDAFALTVVMYISSIKCTCHNQSGDIDVKEVMDTWTQQMGYPVLTVTYKPGEMTISQQRFLLNPLSSAEEEFSSPFK